VAKIPGVTFREQIDPHGDSATFLAFTLSDANHRKKVGTVLQEHGAAAICWAENTWHFYRRWEHLLGERTLVNNGWPFAAGGKRRFVYDPQDLPQSASLLDRTLVYPISIRMSETKLKDMEAALEKASQV